MKPSSLEHAVSLLAKLRVPDCPYHLDPLVTRLVLPQLVADLFGKSVDDVNAAVDTALGEATAPAKPPYDHNAAMRKRVAEAKLALERAVSQEALADDRVLGTPMSDSDLARNRSLSISTGHATAEAEAELAQAEKDLRELKS